jgi:hypothetical protein
MAEGIMELLQRLRQGGGGKAVPTPGQAQTGQPPLASFHESVRLLPNEALKALAEGGIDLANPSESDQLVINDIRNYNKLQPFPWPKKKAPATQGTPRDATTTPGTAR